MLRHHSAGANVVEGQKNEGYCEVFGDGSHSVGISAGQSPPNRGCLKGKEHHGSPTCNSPPGGEPRATDEDEQSGLIVRRWSAKLRQKNRNNSLAQTLLSS